MTNRERFINLGWVLTCIALFVFGMLVSAHASPCPVPLTPQIRAEAPSFKKPEGDFLSPQRFNTLEEANIYQSLNGGILERNYINQGYWVLYAK